jgi:hypothetical protein
MTHLKSAHQGIRIESDCIPVYIHTHRIHERVGGTKFLLRHKSVHQSDNEAINQLLWVLGDNITEELSKRETCAIGSIVKHVCTELTEMDEYPDYTGLTAKDADALETAYFDLMCDWELREEVTE